MGTNAVVNKGHTAPMHAAEALFRAKKGKVTALYVEPETIEEARDAVNHLGTLFRELPGSISDALEGAASGADLLSTDRLQGLAEIVQNADDVDATEVRLLLRDNDLLVAHNGSPVRLPDVLALATPWLTTKAGQSRTTGRFGIGLMTLRALSPSLDVHSAPYHVRLGAPSVTAIEPLALPDAFAGPHWTVLRVPVDEGALTEADLTRWLTRWDDSALLFLRNVARIVQVTSDDDVTHELSLRWDGLARFSAEVGGTEVELVRRRARSTTGNWMVYSAEVPAPPGTARTRKATDDTTPVAVALPLDSADAGVLYAGLPLVATRLALHANAQFDPLASRQGLAATSWNAALVPLIAKLWTEATLDLFRLHPRAAWSVVPLSDVGHDDPETPVHALETELIQCARTELAERLAFDVRDAGRLPLSRLATEVARLTTVLRDDQIADLADLPATLPSSARDRRGRWRDVLADWRAARSDLPDPVDVEAALRLITDGALAAETTIALTAAAIAEGLDGALTELPCVVCENGTRIAPPARDADEVLVSEPSILAEDLGIARRIDPAHRAPSRNARAVLTWLRARGALLDSADPAAAIYRLAAMGRAGHTLPTALTDAQAIALRDAFESLPVAERPVLAEGVGRAVRLAGHTYDNRGRKVPVDVRPVDAYLPKSIDRESDGFAEAAANTPGLRWVAGRYATVLKSPTGRSGVGALQLLRLLRAETAPRLRSHPHAVYRYVSRSGGVPQYVAGSTSARSDALRTHGADFTLDDHDSPDLQAVIENIAKERRPRKRRDRAAALLSVLARSWTRLGEAAEVSAVTAYNTWNHKGHVRAFWLWQAADVAWLDDTSGVPRRPLDLRLRTPATVALYGPDVPGYLRSELDTTNRRPLLAALGVTGDPTTPELIDRLRALRDTPRDEDEPIDLRTETAVVYRALADRIARGGRGAGHMSADRLRQVFSTPPGLIYTDGGWRSSKAVLAGRPIFGTRRAFVPTAPETDALWQSLQIPRPGVIDCVNVLTDLARGRATPVGVDAVVMLETLLLLAERVDVSGQPTPEVRRRLSKLPLWTSRGWTTERPVYDIDDPSLAEGLGALVPVWFPGGATARLASLLPLLRVTPIRSGDTEVVDADDADRDEEATELLHAAIRLLREDLSRNDQSAAGALSIPWDRLERFQVHVHPELTVRVSRSVEAAPMGAVPVAAKAEPAQDAVFVRDSTALPSASVGGQAIASLFKSDHRRVAQAWRVAWDGAEEGRRAAEFVLAQQRAEAEHDRTAADIEARTAAFRDQIGTRRRGTAGKSGATPSPPPAGKPRTETPSRPRVLVEPGKLRLRDPDGKVVGTVPAKTSLPAQREPRPPVEPRRDGNPPQVRTMPPRYVQGEKEAVGLDLLRKVLGGDAAAIVDLRAQRGVGADAMDDLDNFYELKAFSGAEPDRITLEDSEVQKALTAGDSFFLVVASGLEDAKATPTVRIVFDPLRQLEPSDNGSIGLAGVRAARSLVFEFDPEESGGEHAAHDTGQAAE